MLSEVCNHQVCKVLASVGDLIVAFVSTAVLVPIHVWLVHLAMVHNGQFELSHQSTLIWILARDVA